MEDTNYSPYAPHPDGQPEVSVTPEEKPQPQVQPQVQPQEQPAFKSRFQTPQFEITEQGKAYLKETGKWAKFLGVFMAIVIGFMAILGIVMICAANATKGMTPVPAWILGLIYFIMAAIYYFPAKYLIRTGRSIKAAVALNDNEKMEEGLRNIKSYYKFSGILAIVAIALLAITFITVIIVGIAAAVGIG